MSRAYVHGYDRLESVRLQDQARTLEDLLHSDTTTPPPAPSWRRAAASAHRP